ncbi:MULTISPECIES: nuclear transport factor 2 family protein [Actinomadura]|uniref:Nuclear transport factor 2 family protein n=1 Tax=Actinomadura yumaensis TaxID=111807 RepID=A0ABW2CYX7_9ACTN|nr:nuclear transport factor 2 family protein [Actinomadura sp. J1-007]MWK36960.1 hypothetical protein [Actinomadura sp. J1-007]
MGDDASRLSADTRSVLARRAEAVARAFAGEGSFADVLRFHAEDYVWLSPTGVRVGHDEAMRQHARRMAHLPPEAMAGTRVLRQEVAGEYAFTLFKTDTIPFGTDTYRVVDGQVVFHSNAVYLPERYRAAILRPPDADR